MVITLPTVFRPFVSCDTLHTQNVTSFDCGDLYGSSSLDPKKRREDPEQSTSVIILSDKTSQILTVWSTRTLYINHGV